MEFRKNNEVIYNLVEEDEGIEKDLLKVREIIEKTSPELKAEVNSIN